MTFYIYVYIYVYVYTSNSQCLAGENVNLRFFGSGWKEVPLRKGILTEHFPIHQCINTYTDTTNACIHT